MATRIKLLKGARKPPASSLQKRIRENNKKMKAFGKRK